MAKAVEKFTVTEPKFENQLTSLTKMDMVRALNYYNVYAKPEDKKKWALKFIKENAPEYYSNASKAPMYLFTTFAAMCRMIQRGAEVGMEHRMQLHAWIAQLGPRKTDEDEASKVVKPKRAKQNALFQEFDDMLDAAVSGDTSEFRFAESGDVAPILALIDREIATIDATYDAPVYPKHMRKWFKDVRKALETKATKPVRAPVVRKARKVDPVKMTKGVKFQRREESLNITGLSPSDLVGKKKAYFYNTKYRQLVKVVASADIGFMFETGSTTMKNVDLAKSSWKTVRKPEVLKDKMGIRELDRTFNSVLTTKETALLSARVNNNMIILQVS